MPDLKQRINRRGKTSTDAAKETSVLVKALQALALAKAIELAGRLAVGDDKKYKQTIDNTNTAISAGWFFGRWLTTQFSDLIKIIVGKIKGVVEAGTEFYDVPETVERRAMKLVMTRLGFDVDKDELIERGWLQSLVKNHQFGQDLGKQLALAAETRMSPTEFEKKFRQVFVNPGKIGYLDRYFNTFTHDFYMQVDAAIGEIYRKQLGYTNAIWSGTVMNETRPLCEENTNNVFSEKELLAMQETEFQGKKPNHNIFLDRGGYNCRHILSWVSDETAEAIKKGQF